MVNWEERLAKESSTTNLAMKGFLSDDDLVEDLGMIQPDGSRACVDYELRGKGFSLVDFSINPYRVL